MPVSCACPDRLKVDGACYYHLKLAERLLAPSDDHANGHHGTRLSEEQLGFVGVVEPETSGRWDFTEMPDLFMQLLTQEPVRPWDVTVPHRNPHQASGETHTKVMRLVEEGLSRQQIAERLGISPASVDAHRRAE